MRWIVVVVISCIDIFFEWRWFVRWGNNLVFISVLMLFLYVVKLCNVFNVIFCVYIFRELFKYLIKGWIVLLFMIFYLILLLEIVRFCKVVVVFFWVMFVLDDIKLMMIGMVLLLEMFFWRFLIVVRFWSVFVVVVCVFEVFMW